MLWNILLTTMATNTPKAAPEEVDLTAEDGAFAKIFLDHVPEKNQKILPDAPILVSDPKISTKDGPSGQDPKGKTSESTEVEPPKNGATKAVAESTQKADHPDADDLADNVDFEFLPKPRTVRPENATASGSWDETIVETVSLPMPKLGNALGAMDESPLDRMNTDTTDALPKNIPLDMARENPASGAVELNPPKANFTAAKPRQTETSVARRTPDTPPSDNTLAEHPTVVAIPDHAAGAQPIPAAHGGRARLTAPEPRDALVVGQSQVAPGEKPASRGQPSLAASGASNQTDVSTGLQFGQQSRDLTHRGETAPAPQKVEPGQKADAPNKPEPTGRSDQAADHREQRSARLAPALDTSPIKSDPAPMVPKDAPGQALRKVVQPSPKPIGIAAEAPVTQQNRSTAFSVDQTHVVSKGVNSPSQNIAESAVQRGLPTDRPHAQHPARRVRQTADVIPESRRAPGPRLSAPPILQGNQPTDRAVQPAFSEKTTPLGPTSPQNAPSSRPVETPPPLVAQQPMAQTTPTPMAAVAFAPASAMPPPKPTLRKEIEVPAQVRRPEAAASDPKSASGPAAAPANAVQVTAPLQSAQDGHLQSSVTQVVAPDPERPSADTMAPVRREITAWLGQVHRDPSAPPAPTTTQIVGPQDFRVVNRDLGDVMVSVQADSGAIKCHFVCSEPGTDLVLRSQAEALVDELQRIGYRDVKTSFAQSDAGAQGRGASQHQNQNGGSHGQSDTTTSNEPPARHARPAAQTQTEAMDLRI